MSDERRDFEVINIVFCPKEPSGYMHYEEQPDATFAPGDTVWIYMNLKGLEYRENPDETREIWIAEHLTVKDPDGKTMHSREVINEHKNLSKGLDPENLYLKNFIETPPQPVEGKYLVEISVEDKISRRTTGASTSFFLKS